MPVRVGPDGRDRADDGTGWPLPAGPVPVLPVSCGVAYEPARSSDFGKLTTLGSEGAQHGDDDPEPVADPAASRRRGRWPPRRASSSASPTTARTPRSRPGHFNDFVEVGLLRAALVPGGRERPAPTACATTT